MSCQNICEKSNSENQTIEILYYFEIRPKCKGQDCDKQSYSDPISLLPAKWSSLLYLKLLPIFRKTGSLISTL